VRVERVAHREHDIEAEEEVQRQGHELKKLQNVEIRLAQNIKRVGFGGLPEGGHLVEIPELKVADDLGHAQVADHGLPGDYAFTQAHVEDKLVWVGHELLAVPHHQGHATREYD